MARTGWTSNFRGVRRLAALVMMFVFALGPVLAVQASAMPCHAPSAQLQQHAMHGAAHGEHRMVDTKAPAKKTQDAQMGAACAVFCLAAIVLPQPFFAIAPVAPEPLPTADAVAALHGSAPDGAIDPPRTTDIG